MGTRLALISNLLRSSFASGHAQNEADDLENHDCASELLRQQPDLAHREFNENNIVNLNRYESISSKHKG
jgi:hypothetical protein